MGLRCERTSGANKSRQKDRESRSLGSRQINNNSSQPSNMEDKNKNKNKEDIHWVNLKPIFHSLSSISVMFAFSLSSWSIRDLLSLHTVDPLFTHRLGPPRNRIEVGGLREIHFERWVLRERLRSKMEKRRWGYH